MTQRLNFGDTAAAKGSVVNVNHYGDGTGNTASPGQTYGLDIHNYPGSQSALVIHQYSSLARAIALDNTGTQPMVEIHNTQNLVLNPGSDGTGDFILLRDHGTAVFRIDKDLVFRLGGTKVPTFLHTAAKALSVQTASGYNGDTMDITKAGTGSGNGLKVNNSGTGIGVYIAQTGAGKALQIDANTASNAGVFTSLIQGYDYGPSFSTAADSGVTLTVTKNGTGAGAVQQIVNKGTGDSLQLRDASAQKFTVSAVGGITVINGVSVNIIAGTGSPEGARSAPVGSVYLRSDGGAATSLYIKETGTGNTGWVAK
ncbi:hypothetical protein [Arthrobacter globiformis]|uniref:hypothetical protein n=1 Tax=Arthrobacter globiformis TaxID=1665 RepID=UPI0027D854A0|nr:hypothetical protein [Arthrobacter globiformis]